MINLETAISKSKEFLAKMLGLETELYNRKLIHWQQFELLNTETSGKNYIISCSILENIFSKFRIHYRISVDNQTGDITDVSKFDLQ